MTKRAPVQSRRVIVVNKLEGFPYYAEFVWPCSTNGLGKFSSFTFQEPSWFGGMNLCDTNEINRRYNHELRTGAVVVYDDSPKYENFEAAKALSPEALIKVLALLRD